MEGRRGERHAAAGVAHQHLGNREIERALHQQRRGAAGDGLAGEVVTVGAQAPDRAEERAGDGVVGALHDGGDLDLARRGGALGRREHTPSGSAPDQLVQGHAGRHSTTAACGASGTDSHLLQGKFGDLGEGGSRHVATVVRDGPGLVDRDGDQ